MSGRVSARPHAASPSPLYSLALGAVAVTMAILPVLYVALIVVAGYGVYLFATLCFAAVWAWPIGVNRISLPIKVVCSCTPLLVGGAVVIAMIKPLFARSVKRMQPLALNPEVEPGVHRLVQEVCRTLGAPPPRRIELTCDLNASAGFARGWRGFFGGQLILTLGMPLVAGLTQRELAGVVAHEFGHFRQRTGMRVSFLIRVVNLWFARVVYVRDAWDQFLSECTDGVQAHTWWITLMAWCAQLGVAVSRGVLWLLMISGHAVSAALMRQMEYDADRCETRLAGSAAFESTMVKLSTLAAVYGDLHLEMRRSWRSRFRLPDNLPVLVEYRAERMPAERRTLLENKVGLAKTKLLDTHPSAADRVRRARKLAESGYEISDASARDLFDCFEGLSRLVTLAYYEDDLKVPTTREFLVSHEEWVQEGLPKQAAPDSGGAKQAAKTKVAVPMMAYDPSQFAGRRPPGAA